MKNNFRKRLYKATLGGQGQIAVITEVRIDIEPIPPTFASYVILHNDFEYATRAGCGVALSLERQRLLALALRLCRSFADDMYKFNVNHEGLDTAVGGCSALRGKNTRLLSPTLPQPMQPLLVSF